MNFFILETWAVKTPMFNPCFDVRIEISACVDQPPRSDIFITFDSNLQKSCLSDRRWRKEFARWTQFHRISSPPHAFSRLSTSIRDKKVKTYRIATRRSQREACASVLSLIVADSSYLDKETRAIEEKGWIPLPRYISSFLAEHLLFRVSRQSPGSSNVNRILRSSNDFSNLCA